MNLSPEQLGILTDEVKAGVGAETLLRVLGPILQTRIEQALSQLEHSPNDLSTLLNLRARISVLREIQRELKSTIQIGAEASLKLPS